MDQKAHFMVAEDMDAVNVISNHQESRKINTPRAVVYNKQLAGK